MHSFMDCIAGTILGAGIWWWHTDWAGIPYYIQASNPFHNIFTLLSFGKVDASSGSLLVYIGKGLGGGEWTERWVSQGGWEVPFILIPLCLLAVHHHPQPVDDCPCFEDSIAILSVMLGVFISRWVMCYTQFALAEVVVMPGSGWSFSTNEWTQLERGLNDIVLWWCLAALKMAVGELIAKNIEMKVTCSYSLFSARHPHHFRLAYHCKIGVALDIAPNVPSSLASLPTPSPSVLYSCDRIQVRAFRIPFFW